MSKFFVFLEVVIKCIISMVSGAGVGMLVFGVGLVLHGIADFRGAGPPPGPVFIGLGAGLLTTGTTMLGLFIGPLAQRRWFGRPSDYEEPLKKWKAVG